MDHLTEDALREARVTPQVLYGDGDVQGMTPLAHAAATVVKLHGDYTRPGLRNVPAELAPTIQTTSIGFTTTMAQGRTSNTNGLIPSA